MKALEPRDDGSEGGRFPRRATSANPEETSSEPIPVFSPNRLRFSVVATITGNLLALAIGVHTAATGLYALTLSRTLAISASTLHTSLLSMDSPRASASQFVESKRVEKPEPTPVLSPNRLRFLIVATITGILLALTIGVRAAVTGLHVLTLPRALTPRPSPLQASVLSLGTTRATVLQSVVLLYEG